MRFYKQRSRAELLTRASFREAHGGVRTGGPLALPLGSSVCERNVTNGISSENGFLTVKQHAAGNMQQTAGKYSAPASDKVRLLMRQVHAHCTDLRTSGSGQSRLISSGGMDVRQLRDSEAGRCACAAMQCAIIAARLRAAQRTSPPNARPTQTVTDLCLNPSDNALDNSTRRGGEHGRE